MIHSWMLCEALLLSDLCRWLVEEEDAEVVGRVISMVLCPRPYTILDGMDSCKVSWQALPWRTRRDRS